MKVPSSVTTQRRTYFHSSATITVSTAILSYLSVFHLTHVSVAALVIRSVPRSLSGAAGWGYDDLQHVCYDEGACLFIFVMGNILLVSWGQERLVHLLMLPRISSDCFSLVEEQRVARKQQQRIVQLQCPRRSINDQQSYTYERTQ